MLAGRLGGELAPGVVDRLAPGELGHELVVLVQDEHLVAVALGVSHRVGQRRAVAVVLQRLLGQGGNRVGGRDGVLDERSRSWAMAPRASGTTAATRTAAVSRTSASAIRLVMTDPPVRLARSRCAAPGRRPPPAPPRVTRRRVPGRRGLPIRQPEAVAVDGLDQRRVAELAAQRGQVHVEHLGRPVPVLVPGRSTISCRLISRPGSVTRHSRIANSFGVSATSTPVDRHPAGPQVDGQRPVLQHSRRSTRPLAAAQHRPDPGDQFGQPERLDEVVVGAQIQRE